MTSTPEDARGIVEARIANALDAMPPKSREKTEIDVHVPIAALRSLLAEYDRLASLLADVRAMHQEKHGETARYALDDPHAEGEPTHFEPYVICDYDKTTWPCKTAVILGYSDRATTTHIPGFEGAIASLVALSIRKDT